MEIIINDESVETTLKTCEHIYLKLFIAVVHHFLLVCSHN